MVPMPSDVNASSSGLCDSTPVDDVRLEGTRLDGPDAGLELGDHAGVDGLEQATRRLVTDR